MRKGIGLMGLMGYVLSLFAAAPSVAYPYPQEVVYPASVKISTHSKERLSHEVAHYYTQWKQDFLIQEKDCYRIATDKKKQSRTVSEGQGYGMMIVALMAGYDKEAQDIFDGLYRFVKRHPSEICQTFMTWQVPAKKGESDSAFDGDADIAYALLLASKQWGNQGKIDYASQANIMIAALMDQVIGKDSHLPLLGDWVDQNGKKYNQYTTRTSDFMLGHFRAFYRSSGDKRWLAVLKQTQKALQDIQSLAENKTGLVSDFIYHDRSQKMFLPTKKHFLEEQDDCYAYNACRVPWRVGIDALFAGDSTSRGIALKMTSWIAATSKKQALGINAGYTLSGKVLEAYDTAAFIAPFGVSAKLDKTLQPFLEDIYAALKQRHENYYEDSISLLCQLIMIDAFWDPSTVK